MENFNRFLPEEAIVKNDDFIIYANNNIEFIKEELSENLLQGKRLILSFFGLSVFKQIQINLFDSQEVFLNFTRQFYEPMSYEKGNIANEMINLTYEPDFLQKNKYVLNEKIIHELVHLIYMQLWKQKYDRVVWLDEGLAQYLSGEKSLLEKDNNKFKAWYLDNIIRRDKELPPISFLKEHGDNYGKFVDGRTNKYNGYALSYLLIRYILEHNNSIISLLNDGKKIEQLENHLIEDCIKYYDDLFQVNQIKSNFLDLNTPEKLMDYMNKYILYGWLDIQNQEHIDNLKNFREKYKTSSLVEILSTRIGTCIEQAKLIKYFFDNHGVQNKLFCHRSYETEEKFEEKIRMHCFVLFNSNGQWYHFEHSSLLKRGIHQYNSVEEALKNITSGYTEKDIRELTEISEIPDGLSFKEFNQYVNQESIIKKSVIK